MNSTWREQVVKRFTRSPGWSKVRKQHLAIEPACAACGTIKSLHVHHVEPVHKRPMWELEQGNLITLCASCHFDKGHLHNWKSWNIDIMRDAMFWLDKIRNRP